MYYIIIDVKPLENKNSVHISEEALFHGILCFNGKLCKGETLMHNTKQQVFIKLLKI